MSKSCSMLFRQSKLLAVDTVALFFHNNVEEECDSDAATD